MKIHRLDKKTIVLEEIDTFISDLLRKIPESADPSGSESATARLFPPPTGGRDREADEEWQEYIEPGLRELFEDNVAVVAEDLKSLERNGSIRVPVRHLDAWIHTLNQARLALAARHEFTDKELDREAAMEDGERAMVLFQVHFYGLLQEFLLRQEV